MNNKCSLLAFAITVASGNLFALQAMDDDSMQDITGQGGITIEQTSLGENGFVSSMEGISFTQADYEDTGEVTLTIDGTETYMYSIDGSSNRYSTTIKRIIDIKSNGDLHIKTENIDKIDTRTGAMAVNGKKLNGGSEINVWKHAPGSYLETVLENHEDGAKIVSRSVYKQGTGYSQRAFANGITTASDVVYLPVTQGGDFISKLILTSNPGAEGGLKLEFGETQGTIEIQNLRLFDSETGENVHEANKFEFNEDKGLAYYDYGYGNIEVLAGSYMTIRAAEDDQGNRVNGLMGDMAANINVGKLYIRTKDENDLNPQQFNINNTSFKIKGYTDDLGVYHEGKIKYDLKLVDHGRAAGIEAQLVSTNTTADIVLGELKFANGENGADWESANMASIGIKDFSLNGGTLDIGMYGFAAGEKGSPFEDDVSVMQTINADKASFKLTIASKDISDDANEGQSIVQGDVVINNYSSTQFVSNTKRGMETISNSSYSLNINALRAGKMKPAIPAPDVQYREGISGRLVINNYQQINAHTIIEPLRN